MNWSVAINALCSPQPTSVVWPRDRCRVVQLLGASPQCKPKPAPRIKLQTEMCGPRLALTDANVIAAFRTGRATGPASLGLLFGISPSTGHRHLTRLVRSGRLERLSWGRWRVVD